MHDDSATVCSPSFSTLRHVALLCAAGFALVACSGKTQGTAGDNSGGNGNGGGSNGGGSNGGGSGGNSGGNSSAGTNGGGGSGGVVMAPSDVKTCDGNLTPAPIRRLSSKEYMATIRDLFPKSFPPDSDGVWRLDDHSFSLTRTGEQFAFHYFPAGDAYGPADPATFGFINRANNLNPTPSLMAAYDRWGNAIAEFITTGGKDNPVPCTDKTLDCGKMFIDSFGAKAFRRPMTDDEKTDYYAFFNQEMTAGTFDTAVSLTLEVFLQAPQFLYRIELGDPTTAKGGAVMLTQYEIASRLSYLFWSSMPDQALMDAAAAGKLSTPDQLEMQATRLMADPRYRFMAIEFFRQWGDYERIFSESYRERPGHTDFGAGHEIGIFYVLGARKEAESLGEWLMTDGGANVSDLLTTTKTWMNSSLKALYANAVPFNSAMDPALDASVVGTVDATQRSGYLTRALFNWSRSRFDTPSPPLRGSFIMRNLLCTDLPPPPADALSQPVTIDPNTSNRMQFEARMKARADCPGCHTPLNGIGYTFENYNELGVYRTDDHGPVDASGQIKFGTDVDGAVKNALDLSTKLAGSTTVRQCMEKFWYEYAVGRDADGDFANAGVDQCRLQSWDTILQANNGDWRKALVAYVKSPDFVWRPAN